MHFASLSTFIWLDWFLILNPSQLQRSYHTLSGCGSTNAEYFIHPITGNYRVNMHSKFKSTQNDQVRGESLIHHCVPDSCCTSLEPFRQFGPPLHINPPSQSHTLSSLETRVVVWALLALPPAVSTAGVRQAGGGPSGSLAPRTAEHRGNLSAPNPDPDRTIACKGHAACLLKLRKEQSKITNSYNFKE